MTRENKLALVVGFGLILLVGILVSDHLSAANRQESATFARSTDPARVAPRPSDDLIAARPATTTPPPVAPTTDREASPSIISDAATPPAPRLDAPRAADPVQVPGFRPVDEAPARITMGGATAGLTTTPPDSARRTHHVKSGETLSSIAEQYYGTRDAADALAQHNGIADPDLVRVGHRLNIPDAGVLGLAAAKAPAATPDAPPAKAPAKTLAKTPERAAPREPDFIEYTIKDGDRLGEIAKKFLGSSKAVDRLVKANPKTLRDPDHIRVGDTLRIPRN